MQSKLSNFFGNNPKMFFYQWKIDRLLRYMFSGENTVEMFSGHISEQSDFLYLLALYIQPKRTRTHIGRGNNPYNSSLLNRSKKRKKNQVWRLLFIIEFPFAKQNLLESLQKLWKLKRNPKSKVMEGLKIAKHNELRWFITNNIKKKNDDCYMPQVIDSL